MAIDEVSTEMLKKAKKDKIETGRDRLEKMIPQCKFGELGVCCRICYNGPCRIDPFGEGPQKGICGATADTIVTRNLLREAVGGAASHSDHAKELAIVLKEVAEGKLSGYAIKDKEKLVSIASILGIETKDKDEKALALEVSNKALEDFSKQSNLPLNWLKRAPEKEFEMWGKLGLLVSNVNNEITNAMHRSTMGNDADPVNLLLATLRMGIADGYGGLTMATDLSDILFGTPSLVKTTANFGVLKEDYVNIAVHGHSPILSEKIVEWSEKLGGDAKRAGARGINVVGVCCTGNEVMMRQGIPLAAHNLQAELLVVTGALDAMVVDIQCIWPSLAQISECYHTKIITTEDYAKMPGAEHIGFKADKADETAEKIVKIAIESYKNRNPAMISIPDKVQEMYGGFSVETIVGALSKVNADDPLKPVIDNIVEGNIFGVVGVVGCPNIKIRDTEMTERLIKELLKNNVLVVVTGCTGHISAQAGFLTPEATNKYCGDGLKAVLTAVGQAAGLDGPLPPVWHMGSCVDNSRIGIIAGALANKLDVKVSQLPVVASAPEFVTEKAVAIGCWALALGLPLHLAPAPHILGSPVATKVLTEDLQRITGGKAFVEYDPEKAAAHIIKIIEEKRKGLGLK